MGEIADMMLDGTMCQGCGEWLHGGDDGPGYPGYCTGCQPRQHKSAPSYSAPKVNCPSCGKRVKAVGLKDHQRDAHGVKPDESPSFSPNFDERNGLS